MPLVGRGAEPACRVEPKADTSGDEVAGWVTWGGGPLAGWPVLGTGRGAAVAAGMAACEVVAGGTRRSPQKSAARASNTAAPQTTPWLVVVEDWASRAAARALACVHSHNLGASGMTAVPQVP